VKHTKPLERFTREDTIKHGRIETREAAIYSPQRTLRAGIIHDPEWFDIVKKVIHIKKTVITVKYLKGQKLEHKTVTHEYLITNTVFKTIQELVQIVRNHWGIEVCHYLRDTLLLEDKSRIRKNPGAMARMRSIVLNILNSQGVKNLTRQVQENRHAEARDLLRVYRELWYAG
jgi:predicted transposase YbfD/YdcC